MKVIMANIYGKFRDVMYLLNQFNVLKSGRTYIILRVFHDIINSIIPLCYVIFPGLILNELVDNQGITELLIFYIALICVTPLIRQFISITIGLRIEKLQYQMVRAFKSDLHSFISDMEYSSLENPDIEIQRERIINGAPEAPIDMLNLTLSLMSSFIKIIAVITIITNLNFIVVVILSILVIINSIINKKIKYTIYLYGHKLSKADVLMDENMRNMSDPMNAKEVRIYQLKEFLLSRWNESATVVDAIQCEKHKITEHLRLITAFADFLRYIVLYIYIQSTWSLSTTLLLGL